MRSGTGTPRIACQPGISHRPQNVLKLMFIGTCTGMVSGTTNPPSSTARSLARICRGTRSGTRESTVSTFQFIGRFAAALIRPKSSISSSANMSRHPGTIPSSVVPSWRPVSSHSAISSSGVAQRLATGSPSPSLWEVLFVNENPIAPASMAAASSARIAAT